MVSCSENQGFWDAILFLETAIHASSKTKHMNALKNLNQAFQGASPGSTPFALARHLSLPMPVLLLQVRDFRDEFAIPLCTCLWL
jgi:hypothetical protein